MDLLKIVVFVAAFLVLVLLGRVFSRLGEVHAASLPHPEPRDERNGSLLNRPVASEPGPAVVGSEIAFPIRIPRVEQFEDGSYNRPYILNYYFDKTDLLRGPEDHDSFFDELTIETQDPGNHYQIKYSYTVTTPSGLRRVMDDEKLASIYIDKLPVVIVPNWDLALVLHTVMDEIMKTYSGKQNGPRTQGLPETDALG